ncbi:MAG: ABC transporter permease [Lactobacillales bacterium]|jgi:putative ABC transport system permease protein|nr:ABC transporter permease [Lactobacillales bacterium]
MIFQVFQEAWISITAYKLRTFLTTLGIMIGVAAVVMMVAAGQTVQNTINETFESMGGNMIIIVPGQSVSGGIRTSRGRPTVTFDDVESLKGIKDVVAASYIVSTSVQAVYEAGNWNVNVIGTTPDYLTVANWEIERGAAFTDRDLRRGSPYVLLGETVVAELFGMQDPIGKTIRLKNRPFTVIGTLKAKGEGLMGDDQDNLIMMPATTLRQRLRGSYRPNYADVAFVKVTTEDKMEQVANRIEYQLRARHRLKDGVDNDFTIRLMTEMVNQARNVGMILSILLAAIASISLIVGSIGIMNMMLVSVTERTREIGTRKALGAPNKWIMVQFLTESIMISFLGSFVGMVVGVFFSQIAGMIFDKDVPISIYSVIISVSVAVVVGIVSGLMPAIKAMKLDPIEALRYQ